LFYNPQLFKVKNYKLVPYIYNRPEDAGRATRGFLVVSGMLAKEHVTIIVNHLPSRGAPSYARENGGLQLRAVKDSLQKDDPRDAARKRLLKILKDWAQLKGIREDIEYLKGIAERAAGNMSFNQISLSRLNSLYNAFLQQSKDIRTAKQLSVSQS
jgi:hypothetical protein